MTARERDHRIRMIRHAEKVKRNMENLRRSNKRLTPRELADAIREVKEKYPGDIPPPLRRPLRRP
jgi:hypothetical protein